MPKTIYTKSRPLRQGAFITQSNTPQNVNILPLSKYSDQEDSKGDEYSSFSPREKSSLRLPPSILPADHSAISTISIDDIKREEQALLKVIKEI